MDLVFTHWGAPGLSLWKNVGGGNATLRITETWSLSPDGKVLTVKTERDLPAQQQTFNEIYSRR